MSTRIKGAKIALSFGGIDYWADATNVELDNEEASGDVVTFADVEAGGARNFFFNLTAIQSTQTGSFWRYLWANTGTIVAYRYAPHGNAVATADEPHFLGTVKIGAKPKVGGAAGATAAFDARLEAQEEPTLDVGGSGEPTITQITPPAAEVGEPVVISGSRFTGATLVEFDADVAAFVFVSDQTITAIVPAGDATRDVTVTTPAGTSAPVEYTRGD